MSNPDLRDHANRLNGTFGHVSSPIPQQDHGLLGWIYEVQSRHLRPIYDAAKYELQGAYEFTTHTAADIGQAIFGRTVEEEEARARDKMMQTGQLGKQRTTMTAMETPDSDLFKEDSALSGPSKDESYIVAQRASTDSKILDAGVSAEAADAEEAAPQDED